MCVVRLPNAVARWDLLSLILRNTGQLVFQCHDVSKIEEALILGDVDVQSVTLEEDVLEVLVAPTSLPSQIRLIRVRYYFLYLCRNMFNSQ